MNLDAETQAVLLLTARFGKDSPDDAKPLTPAEWSRFARWMHEHERRASNLLGADRLDRALDGWADDRVTLERIGRLLRRSATLGLALEKWERAGLWILTQSHTEYPRRLRERLGFASPAALVGYGNPQLLNKPAIAVVGSREASEEDLAFTARLAEVVAEHDAGVVSGGARGVDQAAMFACVEAGGTSVGVLADSLLRTVTSVKHRSILGTGNMTLVTPFSPEAGFNVGNAMARNRYIYCCSIAALVVAAGKQSGGTWNGAVEALREGWVPVWAKTAERSPEGNASLVRRGAHDLGDRVPTLRELTEGATPKAGAQAELPFAG